MVEGFSSAIPSLARGPQVSAGESTRRRRSSGGGSRAPAPTPTVSIRGGEVMIDGKGFSVAPTLQAEFIRNKTGGRGSSAQKAITQATTRAEEIRKEIALRKITKAPTVEELFKKRRGKIDQRMSKGLFEQKKIDRTGQIYSPGLKAFIAPSEPSGQATAIISPPTIKEQVKIDEATYAGSFERLKDDSKKALKLYEEEVVVPLSKSKPFKAYGEKVIVPLSEKVIEPGKSEISKWKKAYEKKVVRPLGEKGLVIGGKQILAPLKETPLGQIAKAKRIIESKGREFGGIVTSLSEKGISQKEFNLRLSRFKSAGGIVKERKDGDVITYDITGGPTVKIGLPGQIKDVDVSEFQDKGLIGFGKQVYGGEVEKAFTDITKAYEKNVVARVQKALPEIKETPIAKAFGTEESLSPTIGKGARLISELGAYAIPGYFGAEIGGELGEAALGGKFGGPKNIVEFVKERPIEVALLGALGAGKAVKFLRSTSPEIKYAKLLATPEKKAVLLESEIRADVLRKKIIKPKLKLAVVDDITKFKVDPRIKGKLVSKEFIPTRLQAGEVIELREIGKKAGKKAEKIFKGTAELTGEGIYTETVKYSDDITKIIEVGKEGEAMVKLLRKNKKIFEKKLKDAHQPILKFKRPKLLESKVDRQAGAPGIMIEQTTLKKGKRVEDFIKATDPEGRIIVSDIKPSLKSKLVKSELKSKSIFGEDLSSGAKQVLHEESGFLDIISVGERKQLKKILGTKGGITKKTKVGQRIEFGIDKEIDTSLFVKKKGAKVSIKSITPTVKRDITQFSGKRTTTIFTKPDTKVIKETTKKAKALVKKRGVKIKAIERTQSIKEFDELVKSLTESQKSKALARKNLINSKMNKLKTSLARDNKKIYQSRPQTSEYSFGQKLGPRTDIKTVTYVEPTETFLKRGAVPTLKSPPVIKGLSIVKKSPLVGTKALIGVSSLSKILQRLDQKAEQKISQKVDQKIDQRLDQKVSQKVDQRLDQKVDQKVSQKLSQRLDQKIDQRLDRKIAQKFKRRPLIQPVIRPVTELIQSQKKTKLKTVVSKPSLTPKKEFYMPKAKRNNKWVKLSDTGLLEKAAQGRGARATDKTIAGRFKIDEVATGNPKIIDNYFALHKNKFRDYKIVKGKRVPLKNTWIERKGKSRIDTPEEKKGLTLAKLIKKNDWLGKKAKKRKTKAKKSGGSKLKIPRVGII